MTKIKLITPIVMFLLCVQTLNAQKTNEVNTLIGTDAHGHTYPGATSPFGMIQLSPDTRQDSWDGCSGYHYSDKVIYGFSHTHLSGTGCLDYGDILFIPTIKAWSEKDFSMTFSHKNETASAGYYAISNLNNQSIDAFLTTTPRVGFHKYSFPASAKQTSIIIDLLWRDELLDCSYKILNDSTIVGYRCSKSWNENQKIFFATIFSQKISKHNFDEQTKKLFLEFELAEANNKKTIEARTAISSVSEEGALKNLASEECIRFDKALTKNTDLWEKELGKIEISGASKKQKEIFYTSLYHCMIAPNLYSDVDNRYRGMDDQIHRSKGYKRYTVFSLWDTYRTLHPLLSIIDQERSLDFTKTFIDMQLQNGELPMWELASAETHCMIGMHGVSVLAELYQKGLGIYPKLTLESMLNNTDPQLRVMNKRNYTEKKHNLLGLDRFTENGYISSEFEHEGVSKTVEYAYNMYCVAQVAKSQGRMDLYNEYIAKSQYYKNLINPATGFIEPKENGRFLKNFDLRQIDQNYTEGNGWHYTFYAPHDIPALINLMGGELEFCKKLDKLFSKSATPNGRNQADVTGLIGGYAHGNEPSQHSAYLYTYAGQPHKTQQYVRQILTTLYDNTPDGICGNDDAGQMSAWYVMSSMGIYPVSPVDKDYIITTPLFERSVIHLENGKTLTITAPGAEKKKYISKVYFNGTEIEDFRITHEQIMSGGELTFVLSEKPVIKKNNVVSPREKKETDIVVTPYLSYDGTATFTDSLIVEAFAFYPEDTIELAFESGKTLSFVGKGRFVLNESESLSMYSKNGKTSQKVEAKFYKIPKGRKVKVLSKYNNQYTAGGDEGLIDQKRGGDNWKLGLWQGYWGEDFVAVLELTDGEKPSRLGANFIQDQKSWIFLPVEVTYYVSDNGKDYKLLEIVKNDMPERNEEILQKAFYTSKPINHRFVKVVAKNIKTNPSWHLSAGEKSWLFTDELIIEF